MSERAHSAHIAREAHEHVQFLLGFISLVIWFLLAFGIVIALDLAHPRTQSRILLVGGIALIIAAVPWLAYPRLYRAERDRRTARAGPSAGSSTS